MDYVFECRFIRITIHVILGNCNISKRFRGLCIQALGPLINSFSSNLLIKGPIAHKQWEENILEMLKFAKNKQRLVCIVFSYLFINFDYNHRTTNFPSHTNQFSQGSYIDLTKISFWREVHTLDWNVIPSIKISFYNYLLTAKC